MEIYNLIYVTHTHKAVGVKEYESDRDVIWLAKSQIQVDEIDDPNDYNELIVGEVIEVEIPDWLAENVGLL